MIQPNSLHEEQPPMLDIIIVFTCLSQYLAPTTLRQLHRVTEAMLSMTGRVTMKGLSRWTDQGGSYRTVQRFFNTSISWCKLQWVLIRHHLLEPDDVIVMGGDEVVVTNSGKQVSFRQPCLTSNQHEQSGDGWHSGVLTVCMGATHR